MTAVLVAIAVSAALSAAFFWLLLSNLTTIVARSMALRRAKQRNAAAVSRLAAAQAGELPQAAVPPNPSADPSAPADPARSTD